MKVLLLLLVVSFTPALATDDVAAVRKGQLVECRAEGGCIILTAEAMKRMLEEINLIMARCEKGIL